MYSNKNSIWLIGITISMILLCCTIQTSSADADEEEHHLAANMEDEDSADGDIENYDDFHRRASLRPVLVNQRASLRPFTGKRASLRPFAGKRASLRPFAGKRASLRPFAGKRASLRPTNYLGKRKRRSVMNYDQ